MSATPRCIVVDAQGVPVSDAGRPSVLEFPDWEIATAWLERSKLDGHRVVRLERIHPSVVRDCRKHIGAQQPIDDLIEQGRQERQGPTPESDRGSASVDARSDRDRVSRGEEPPRP